MPLQRGGRGCALARRRLWSGAPERGGEHAGPPAERRETMRSPTLLQPWWEEVLDLAPALRSRKPRPYPAPRYDHDRRNLFDRETLNEVRISLDVDPDESKRLVVVTLLQDLRDVCLDTTAGA